MTRCSSALSSAKTGAAAAGCTPATKRPRVPPCIPREIAATQKAMRIIAVRPGSPLGSVCAAATVTAPRMPAQTMVAPSRVPRRSCA